VLSVCKQSKVNKVNKVNQTKHMTKRQLKEHRQVYKNHGIPTSEYNPRVKIEQKIHDFLEEYGPKSSSQVAVELLDFIEPADVVGHLDWLQETMLVQRDHRGIYYAVPLERWNKAFGEPNTISK